MKSYYDMIKSGIINFRKVLLEKYTSLGLDEVDCIILLKLHEEITNGDYCVKPVQLAKSMTVSENVISQKIVEMINNDFISLEIKDLKGPEVISIEPLFQKLGYSLEEKEVKIVKNELAVTVKEVSQFIEKELNKMLAPYDLETIKRWFYDCKYTKDEVIEAVLLAKKYKNRGINFIDTTLYRSHHKEEDIKNPEVDTLKLFEKVYAKR